MAGCLVGVVAALLVVGVVSDTVVRHVVQVAPVLLTLGFVLRLPTVGVWMAIPVLAIWGMVMLAIWAYLLGLSDITSGSFSAVEVVLTIVIAACSAWGVREGVRAGRRLPLSGRLISMAVGGALQIAFLVLSLQAFE